MRALFAAAFCCAGLALAADPQPEQKGPGGFPRGKPPAKAEEAKKGSPPMSTAPAPKSGSMPTGPAPKGKLGTEPRAKGKLGTDPQPRDPKDRPPRFN
jgi:hypothetical protein